MIPIKPFALAAAALAALSFALPAGAQPTSGQAAARQPAPGDATPPGGGYGPPQGGGRGFGRPMTLAQYQERFRDRILRADTDHDGRVSLAEWTAYSAGRDGEGGGRRGGDSARQFQTMDADHDGYVTPAEIDAASAARFARMDANHDGVLTPDERRAMRGGGMGGGQPVQPQ